jgi:hypothetical protein
VAATESENHGWESGRPELDAALIALAPEMAEAILAWADKHEYLRGRPLALDAEGTAFARLADKLRQIGSEQ